MPHLNFKQHEDGVWSVEADPVLAMKDLTEFAMKSPQKQKDWMMEEHQRIHFIKSAIRIVEQVSQNHEPALLAMELAKMNVNIMLVSLLEEAQDWEDEEKVQKAVALFECWNNEIDEHLTTMSLN